MEDPLRRIKKGEEGLEQLRDYFVHEHSDIRAYELRERIMEYIASSEDGYVEFHELYGYNENHDLAEGSISHFRKGKTYIYKDLTTVTKSDGRTFKNVAYTLIAPDKKGRYNIMMIVPNTEDKSKIEITDQIGTTAEKRVTLDMANDIPRKYYGIFNRAFEAMVVVDEEQRKYKEERRKTAERRKHLKINMVLRYYRLKTNKLQSFF